MPIVTTALPVSCLTGMEACHDFLTWLKKNKQGGWLQLPINDPIDLPYKNYGIGISSYFFDTRLDSEHQKWVVSKNEFLILNESWVFDYAFYKALSDYFHTDEWWTWPVEIKRRDSEALLRFKEILAVPIENYLDEQYYLMNQFIQLKNDAASKQLILIGDLPFYIAQNSPLTWVHQDAFVLNSDGVLRVTSGVPNAKDEPFSAQVWGHPLYDWQGAGANEILKIFEKRILFLSQIYDMVRVDHANGFFRYGVMYPANPNWNKKTDGPGTEAAKDFLALVQKYHLGLFFEDIGSDTTKLEYFMKDFEIMGMKVFTLAVNTDGIYQNAEAYEDHNLFDLKNYDGNNVVFSSTHDTPTLFGWIRSLSPEAKLRLQLINKLDQNMSDEKLATVLRDKLIKSKAPLVVILWQDWQLETFRFNIPGQEEEMNWNYKIKIKDYL